MLIGAIAAQGLSVEERPFTVAEALAAREAFLTSASQIVMPIVRIDGERSAPASRGRLRGPCGDFPSAMPNGVKNPNFGRNCLFSPNLCFRRPRRVPCNPTGPDPVG